MDKERIKELLSNEEFVKELFESGSFEAAQAKLADKGVEVSVDELKKTYELIKKKEAGELTDEELENVAGGLFIVDDILIVGILVLAFVKDDC